jgi:hypothetical protein
MPPVLQPKGIAHFGTEETPALRNLKRAYVALGSSTTEAAEAARYHSGLMPANWIAFAHFSDSAAT